MRILQRYLTQQLLTIFFSATIVLVILMWMTQSLRFLDYVVNHGLDLLSFLKITGFLLPGLLAVIIPFSFMASLIFLFYRLEQDSELIVMRAAGLTNFQIMKPIFAFAGVCYLGVLSINLFVQPEAKREISNERTILRNQLKGQWLQPGRFQTFDNITFYARDKSRTGSMRGVIIYDARITDSPVVFTADYGYVTESENGLKFQVFDGTRQTIDQRTGKPMILSFEYYDVVMQNPKMLPRALRFQEMSLWELNASGARLSPEEYRKRLAELHERFIYPLLLFISVVMVAVMFLRGAFKRGGRPMQILTCAGLCFGYQICIYLVSNIGKSFTIIGALYAMFFVTFILGFVSMVVNKHEPFWRLLMRKERP